MATNNRKPKKPYSRTSPKDEIQAQIEEQKALELAEIEEVNAMLDDFFENEYVYRAPDEIFEEDLFFDFDDDDDDIYLSEEEEDWYLDL